MASVPGSPLSSSDGGVSPSNIGSQTGGVLSRAASNEALPMSAADFEAFLDGEGPADSAKPAPTDPPAQEADTLEQKLETATLDARNNALEQSSLQENVQDQPQPSASTSDVTQPEPAEKSADAMDTDEGEPDKDTGDAMDTDKKTWPPAKSGTSDTPQDLPTRFAGLSTKDRGPRAKGKMVDTLGEVDYTTGEPGEPEEANALGRTDTRRKELLTTLEKFDAIPNSVKVAIAKAKQVAIEHKIGNIDPVYREYRGSDRPAGWKTSSPNVHVPGDMHPQSLRPVCISVRNLLRGASSWSAASNLFGGPVPNADATATTFEMRYQPDSQMPHFQVRLKRPSREWVYVTIFGNHLSKTAESPIIMNSGRAASMTAHIYQEVGQSIPKMSELARADRMSETRIKLVAPQDPTYGSFYVRPKITGDVTRDELNALLAPARRGDPQSEGDRFLAWMHGGDATDISFYVPYKAPVGDNKLQRNEWIQMQNFIGYFVPAIRLCSILGNDWIFREQAPGVDWQSPQFPFGSVFPPYYLVQLFGLEKKVGFADDAEDAVPENISWASLMAPLVWPSPDELNFRHRLAISRERQFQGNYVKKLFEAHANGVKAVFTPSPLASNTWLAEFTTTIEHHKLRAVLPETDTSLTVELEGGKKLFGRIVENQEGSNASFSAMVNSYRPDNLGTAALPVKIEFRDDSTSFRRSMQSMQEIAHAHPQRKTGIYMPNLLLGAEIPGEHDTTRTIPPEKLQAFTYDIQQKGLNPEQEAAAIDTLKQNASILWGPPGTGKTSTLIAAIQAHVKAGHQVLVCGPTNEAVSALVEGWVQAEGDTTRGNYAVWKGAFLKQELQGHRSAPAPDRLVTSDAQQGYWAQVAVEAAADTSNNWRKKGFAHRRWQLINKIIDHGNHVLTQDAKDYVELLRRIRDLDVKEKNRLMAHEDTFSREFLKDAKVIFSTCSMSCHPLLMEYFKTVIIFIDEAGSATLADIATPCMAFKNTVETVVLCGDHKQQPPVITSGSCNEGYNSLVKPLFEMLVDEPTMARRVDQRVPVNILLEQFRMHPDISDYPNRQFYEGRLRDAPSTSGTDEVRATMAEFMSRTRGYFGGDAQRNRVAIDISDSASKPYGHSTSPCNEAEAEFIVKLILELLNFRPTLPGTRQLTARDIIVVSPYTGQRKTIFNKLVSCGNVAARQVRTWTTTSVQGHEGEIEIISLVQNDPYDDTSIGFIWRPQQLNVELTRARKFQFIMGNFWNWSQGFADNAGKFASGRYKPFSNFLGHLRDKNDIVTIGDFLEMMGGKQIPREEGQFPLEFKISARKIAELEEAADEASTSRKQDGKNRATNVRDAVIDPITGEKLKPPKIHKPNRGGKKDRGNRGGRGGSGGGDGVAGPSRG